MTTDGRRFDDSVPQLDPITESHWDRLNGEERADLLRRRHAQVIEALGWNVDATRRVAKQVDESVMPLLKTNTEATTRIDEIVLESKKALDLLVERTEKPLAIWQDWQGATGLVGRLASLLKDLAPLALAAGAMYGGWQALSAWAHFGFPGLK